MSTTVLRLGFYIVILALILFVYATSFPEAPFSQLIEDDLVRKVLIIGGIMLAAGVLVRIFEKTAGKAIVKSKNKCQVCGTPVPVGAIYCRPHLRGMLEREDRKTHNTRIR